MSELKPPQIHQKIEISTWYVSAIIISINITLFLLQVFQGMDVAQPSTQHAIQWGADYAPLTFLEQPQRLFTSMFFHFGLVHLMLNMWALYIFGNVAEQLFGRCYFLVLYLCAGVMGSLFSAYMSMQDSFTLLLQHQLDAALLPKVSAGASGAVMGLGAALTFLSVLPRLKNQSFILDKKTLIIMMALNLALGFMISGINNAAHIGGMCMGIFFALFWYLGQKWQRVRLMQFFALLAAILLCGVLYQYCMNQLVVLEPLWREVLQAMRQHFNF